MLRSLLAPLRNLHDLGHDISESSNDAQSAVTPHESALESQVRSQVELLKLADDTHSRITVKTNVASLRRLWNSDNVSQILQTLQAFIGEHPGALDAFREADGFLVLMHVLSTLSAIPSALSSPQSTQQVFECMQLAFMLASKALYHHPINLTFFEVRRRLCSVSPIFLPNTRSMSATQPCPTHATH